MLESATDLGILLRCQIVAICSSPGHACSMYTGGSVEVVGIFRTR